MWFDPLLGLNYCIWYETSEGRQLFNLKYVYLDLGLDHRPEVFWIFLFSRLSSHVTPRGNLAQLYYTILQVLVLMFISLNKHFTLTHNVSPPKSYFHQTRQSWRGRRRECRSQRTGPCRSRWPETSRGTRNRYKWWVCTGSPWRSGWTGHTEEETVLTLTGNRDSLYRKTLIFF